MQRLSSSLVGHQEISDTRPNVSERPGCLMSNLLWRVASLASILMRALEALHMLRQRGTSQAMIREAQIETNRYVLFDRAVHDVCTRLRGLG